MFDAAISNQGSRLVVLIPEILAGNMELSRKVAQTARGKVQEVTYFVILQDLRTSLQATRSMATMKAMTSDRALRVSYQVLFGQNAARTFRNLASKQEAIIIPQPCEDHAGKFKFLPVRYNDWIFVKFALSNAANKYSRSDF